LFLGLEQKRKSDIDTFGNELNFSSDLYNSNLNSDQNSHFKFTNSIIINNNNNNKKESIPIINIYREEDRIIVILNDEEGKRKLTTEFFI
jgi:hypothetical protein